MPWPAQTGASEPTPTWWFDPQAVTPITQYYIYAPQVPVEQVNTSGAMSSGTTTLAVTGTEATPSEAEWIDVPGGQPSQAESCQNSAGLPWQ